MAKVSTSISLDAEVREQAVAMLNEFGLDLSTAVGVFLRQMIRENRFPFRIGYTDDPAGEKEATE